ncbi:hypothetical protein [Campylobacter concisus]|uniref:hypothetical protein n=1 Tax=Campylobacter concisus TaxID=199 RepID=UPI000CD8A692|nr:hypothetical protein [Campylobacter concisus]
MINALNGLNQSFNYQDTFNKQPTTIANLGKVKISPQTLDIKHLSLSGYSSNDKISIWGKINGIDSKMSKSEVASLKNFVDSTKLWRANSILTNEKNGFSVDEFNKTYHISASATNALGIIINQNNGALHLSPEARNLLDSDLSIDDFKDKWLEFTAERILGEHANVKISFKDGALHYEQTSAKKRIEVLGQAMPHRVSYADKNSKDEFLKFLKTSYEKGENIADVLQNIALVPVREDGNEEIEEEKFKPMQVTKKSVTYTNKDIKREFFEEFIRREVENGASFDDLVQKLNKLKPKDILA